MIQKRTNQETIDQNPHCAKLLPTLEVPNKA